MIAELREEMQKLSNYEAAQQRLKEMEALEDDGKGAQVKKKKKKKWSLDQTSRPWAFVASG